MMSRASVVMGHLLPIAFLVLGTGCYNPDFAPCKVQCGPGGVCPGRMACDHGVCSTRVGLCQSAVGAPQSDGDVDDRVDEAADRQVEPGDGADEAEGSASIDVSPDAGTSVDGSPPGSRDGEGGDGDVPSNAGDALDDVARDAGDASDSVGDADAPVGDAQAPEDAQVPEDAHFPEDAQAPVDALGLLPKLDLVITGWTAHDAAFGPDGTLWIIGPEAVTGGFQIERWNGLTWDFDDEGRSGAVRIAIDPMGVPCVVISDGTIARKETTTPLVGTWQIVEGNATDISVGAEGSIWVLGTNPTQGGYPIYKWNGFYWVTDNDPSTGAVRIAIGPDGVPWAITDSGDVVRKTAPSPYTGRWELLSSGGGIDISISPEGAVFALFTSAGSLDVRVWDPNLTAEVPDGGHGGWVTVAPSIGQAGPGAAIAAGPGGNVVVVDDTGLAFKSRLP